MPRSVVTPSYFYPGATDSWARLVKAAMYVSVVLLNPDSGPGAERLQDFATVVQQSQAAGIKVLGYIASGYGTRAIADLVSEINLYSGWYGVDGIFVDEMNAVGEYQVLVCSAFVFL